MFEQVFFNNTVYITRQSFAALSTDVVTQDRLPVGGRLEPGSTLTINALPMTVAPDGAVSGEVPLDPGYNTLDLELTRPGTAGVLRATHTLQRTLSLIPVPPAQMLDLAPGGDLYFRDTAGQAQRLPAGTGAVDRPLWLEGARDVATDAAGRVYLLKGSASQDLTVDLPGRLYSLLGDAAGEVFGICRSLSRTSRHRDSQRLIGGSWRCAGGGPDRPTVTPRTAGNKLSRRP